VEALNQAAAESAKAAQEIAASLRPSVVRVDVLGYGE
jgi:filamentous hemagglutinin